LARPAILGSDELIIDDCSSVIELIPAGLRVEEARWSAERKVAGQGALRTSHISRAVECANVHGAENPTGDFG
jgi:hypothetical protein